MYAREHLHRWALMDCGRGAVRRRGGEAVSGPECAPALCVPGRAPCGSVTGRAEEGSVSEEFRRLLRSELSQSGDAHETQDVRNNLVGGLWGPEGGASRETARLRVS